MMDSKLMRKLLKIKTHASSSTNKLQRLEQIREAWDTRGEKKFSSSRIHIGFLVEYATEACELVVDSCKQLLHGPPPYGTRSDQQREMVFELDILCDQACVWLQELEQQMQALTDYVASPMESRVAEAWDRADMLCREAAWMKELARVLVTEVDEKGAKCK